jgi:hypothetical protein
MYVRIKNVITESIPNLDNNFCLVNSCHSFTICFEQNLSYDVVDELIATLYYHPDAAAGDGNDAPIPKENARKKILRRGINIFSHIQECDALLVDNCLTTLRQALPSERDCDGTPSHPNKESIFGWVEMISLLYSLFVSFLEQICRLFLTSYQSRS